MNAQRQGGESERMTAQLLQLLQQSAKLPRYSTGLCEGHPLDRCRSSSIGGVIIIIIVLVLIRSTFRVTCLENKSAKVHAGREEAP